MCWTVIDSKMRMCDGDIPHEICSSKVFLGFCALLNRLIRSAVMRIPVCGLNVLLYGCVHNFFLFFFYVLSLSSL